MPSATDNPVVKEEVVVVELEPPAEDNHGAFSFAITFLFNCIRHMERLSRVWVNYYPRIFGEEEVIMFPSPLNFIVIGLYAFTEIKSQGSDFPFKTHPRSTNVAVTSLLFYGLASIAKHFISATRLGPASVYAIIANLGRIGSLCILPKRSPKLVAIKDADIDLRM
ncbi:hypothetical protein L2E82_47701 [Cichorium intybus]|uniref:Uncharacterized protein n=1 Tax=Cichorium intybus TaxID=13427 RepID=A0ACB8YWH3_CICIN|nr:hypothetical protein L2E82_47701 [Cichorium intybus]